MASPWALLVLSLVLVGLARSVAAQTVVDPALQVETVVGGLASPTSMAFLAPDDILVLQKQDGQVRRVIGGVLQPAPVLDVAVNNAGERGLLGIAINTENPPAVFLYYTEADDPGASGADGGTPLGNRVYRYTWNGATGTLESPQLLLTLPVSPPTAHNGGVVAFGPVPAPAPGQVGDGSLLHVVIGDLGFQGQLQNFPAGPPPNDAAVIFRLQQDGTPAPGNPFVPYCSATTTQTCPSGSGCPAGETCVTEVARYFAYGVRNSFGMAIDPLTGDLWETENGPIVMDEINRVPAGLNSGWAQLMGPDSRDPQGVGDLFDMPGSGSTYSDPEFSWVKTIAPTAILFPVASALGPTYDAVALVGDANNGQLYRFPLNGTRDGFDFSAFPALQDLVAEGNDGVERDLLRFGSGFGVVTDLELGPDGRVYVVSLAQGAIYRITPPFGCAPTPEPCRTPAVGERARLLLRDNADDDRDLLEWKWLKGAATTKPHFASPVTGDDYALCVYDGTGLLTSARAPGGSGWRESAAGFSYRTRDGSPDGLRTIRLRPGVDARATIVTRARGASLTMPNLATLASPMTVQLKKKNGAVCWGARYSFPPATANDATLFRDRAD